MLTTRPRRNWLIVLLVPPAFAAVLSACGGNDSKPTQTPQPVSTSVASVLTPTVTPEPEGTRADGANESPVSALKRQISLLNEGDLGGEWAELHPSQQAVVSRARFEECVGQSRFAIDSVDVIDTRDSDINVAEVQEKRAKALTAVLRSGDQSVTRTFYEVLVDRRWRWVLDSSAVEQYRAGQCPVS